MPLKHTRSSKIQNLKSKMSDAVARLRREYTQRGLQKAEISTDPIEQFKVWFAEARKADVQDANAMTLATATPEGQPSARIVLLKGVDQRGFVFFTNYNSRKGRELRANPRAALVFWWQPLERQVRVEGTVSRLSPEASADYFQSRPRGSQLGAWASSQSDVIDSRDTLVRELREVEARYRDQPVPCPSYWGGYCLDPIALEFWQGRPNRLHDRLRYRRDGSGVWHLERLAP